MNGSTYKNIPRLIIKQKIEKKCVDKLSFLYFSQLEQYEGYQAINAL
jgi:hypothetical protein